jgi:Ca2+/Na+ antiporter
MVDSSLSIGIGPLVSPTWVTASSVIRGSLTTMGVVTLAILILSLARRHDWRTGVALLILYLGVYVVLLGT